MSPLALSLRFLQTQSDAQLAALARAGHERSFEALVRRYRRPLLAYCRRIGSSGVNPEDTLQQALLQAWSAIHTGVDVRDPRAWLYRIVHNVAISNQRRPALVPVELQETTGGANGADLEAEQRMAAHAALAGLAALPHLQREVMVGTAVDGLSHEELASALGLSSGAVRGLIYRARATLRAAAAAVIPAPVIGWALRSGAGRASGVYEGLGGGAAGLGGILLKGGALAATAGAIATAGISTNQRSAHHRAAHTTVAAINHAARQQAPASAAVASAVLVGDGTRASLPGVRDRPHGGSRPAESRETSHRGSESSPDGFVTKRRSADASSGSGEGHDSSGHGPGSGAGSPGSSGGPKSGSGDRGPGGGSGGDGHTTGSGHGADDPAGHVPGSDGGSHSGSGSSTGSGDGGTDGADGGGSAAGASTPVTTATPDHGSDGSGHDGGSTPSATSTTSTTTTVTTATVPTTDGGGSGHHGGK